MNARPLIAACILSLVGCGDSPDALGPESSVQVDGVPGNAVAAGHEDEILDLIDGQVAAWAAKDGNAYGATYTEDAEFINPIGNVLIGRSTIAAQHVFLFNPVNGPFRSSTSSMALRDLIFLTGAIALVKLDVTLTGFSALPPGLPAVEPGVVRTRVTWVAIRRNGEWLIMHQQMTPLPPTP